MLDANVRTRIREYISAELAPRQRTLAVAITTCQRQHSARGLLNSSAFIFACARVCRDELTVRANLIWNAIRRSHASLVGKADARTFEDLRQQLGEYLSEHTAAIAAQCCERVKWDGTRWHDTIRKEISDRCQELLGTLNVEAQFYVDTLEAQAKQQTSATPGMVFNAPVGAVQTGAFATAHVSLSGPETDRLTDGLGELRQALAQNTEIQDEQKRQADELVDELIGAIKAEKPNPPRIAGLLGGLAQTVRTVASVRPAWETVRDAAIAIGLPIF